MSSIFEIRPGRGKPAPILISAPHTGVLFPEEIKPQFNPKYLEHPEDTDWFVDELYSSFAADLGITVIKPKYSRYVIDLNRSPVNEKLYHDQRQETSLVSSKTFEGQPLYKNPDQLNAQEIERRLELYYKPYHAKIREILGEMRKTSEHVLFFDGHSIRRVVSTIQAEPFPDLILGDADGKSAHPALIEVAMKTLTSSPYRLSHNHPFKGGYLTRSFGQPAQGVHALQLEMSQDIYMDEKAIKFVPEKREKLQKVLRSLIENLTVQLQEL